MTHEFSKGKDCFQWIGENGQLLAEITYRNVDPATIIVDHTFVSPELRGRGVAEALVEAVSNFARSEGLKIQPTCPYAKRLMLANERFKDVLVPL